MTNVFVKQLSELRLSFSEKGFNFVNQNLGKKEKNAILKLWKYLLLTSKWFWNHFLKSSYDKSTEYMGHLSQFLAPSLKSKTQLPWKSFLCFSKNNFFSCISWWLLIKPCRPWKYVINFSKKNSHNVLGWLLIKP